MRESLLTLQTNKYNIKIDNFEGPLDLLCHLIDLNKMDIYDVNISEIADQYIDYLKTMEELNLEITSEFLIMATNLLYLKSKKLLPRQEDDEEMLSEDDLIQRIIEYKKYKEITNNFREMFSANSNRIFNTKIEQIELPKLELEEEHDYNDIADIYRDILNREKVRVNKNAKNIEKIAITENYSVGDTVKTMFRELIRKSHFVFNKLYSLNKCNKNEVVTAFTGLLEMSRRDKVVTSQEELFGDIDVSKKRKVTK